MSTLLKMRTCLLAQISTCFVGGLLFAMPTMAISAAQLPGATPVAKRPDSFPNAIDSPDTVQPGMLSDVLLQDYNTPIGTKTIIWNRAERADANATWERVSHVITVDYWITAVTSRNGGDDLFVAGMNTLGESIIERWTVPRRKNSHYSEYPSSPPPLGQSKPSYCPTISTEGGVFEPGLETSLVTAPVQDLVSRSQGGPWTQLAVDPEGRFLLAYDWNGKEIVRFDLTAGLPLPKTTIFSSSSTPSIAAVGHMDLREYDGTRTLLIDSQLPGTYRSLATWTVIQDNENDGTFDEVQVFSYEEYYASIYAQWEKWREHWKVCTP